MPHIVTFDAIKGENRPIVDPTTHNVNSAQMGELRSDHIGAFKALNETTNFRPQQGESTSIVHPAFRTGLISPDQMRPVDSLSETFGDGDPKILGPLSGNGVFNPQDIDSKGSVIWGDNHFRPDPGGDSNDVVIGDRENIDWTAANGGPGSSYLTAKTASKTNAFGDEDVDGFMKLGDIKGELQTTDLRSENRFVIERFEPLDGMYSFAESHQPVPGDAGFQLLEGASVEIGQPPDPKLWLQMLG